jgi:quercetin dioxygenase-like cupin family protein
MKGVSKWRGNRTGVIVGAVLVGCIIGAGADHFAFAQQPGIQRTILLRTDAPSNPAYEAVMGIAEIPPGVSAGKHRHNGIEVGYVLQGTVQLEHEGQPLRTLTAGQAFANEAGVHNAKNVGKGPVKILAVYIVEKGKPLAEPVP